MKNEIVVNGKSYKIKIEDTFKRKNLFGKMNSWKSYRLAKGYRWITIGLIDKPILWERQSKILKGVFNPKLSGALYMNNKLRPVAFIYSFDISKTTFFAIERFPDGREYRLVGKVL